MSSIKLESNASGTGIFTIASPNSNTNRTLTLPDATGTINTSGSANEVPAGSASTPSIYPAGDTNTGIFFPAADTIAFAEGGAEAMRINSSGQLLVGTTSNPNGAKLNVRAGSGGTDPSGVMNIVVGDNASYTSILAVKNAGNRGDIGNANGSPLFNFEFNNAAGMSMDLSGNLLVGTTNTSPTTNNVNGFALLDSGQNIRMTATSSNCLDINRKTDDGNLVLFRQDGTIEGTISVSGSTVSYNGGHLSRWAQMLTKPDLLKGTVMSNLDEMNVYIAPTTYWTEEDELPEGVNVGDVKVETHEVQNEQLNKVKVSDVEGDVNVAGVFVNWTYDEAHQVDEINMAMTGDMIIRIAQGVVVQKGDLLMSAGDGTAKPQDDDIVRSKTVAKVTSNHVTCTYADGSYCVPCVLMAC